MRQHRLSSEQTGLLMGLHGLGVTNVEIARKLGITEGAVRYRIKRQASGERDRRTEKPSQLESFHWVIASWIDEYRDRGHRPTLMSLDDMLRGYHGYTGSYDAVRRYVRKHFPGFLKKGARLRIETPPGVLMQLDWKEDLRLQVGGPDQWVTVHALCFSLSFSRKMVVRVLDKKTLEAFIHGHQEAFRQLGGLSGYLRPDCLRTAIVRWLGARSVINTQYQRYLEGLGVQVFPSRPGTPTDKGKIEKRIQDLFRRLNLPHKVFPSLKALQSYVDARLDRLEREWLCGATGLTVAESFAYEKKHLQPLPVKFPVLPVKEAHKTVRRDGTVFFDGNYYQLPDVYRDKTVLCLHTGQEILIYHEGIQIGRFDHLPYAKGMVRLHPGALSSTPIPLSDTVRTWALEVAQRQVQIYDDLMTRRAQ